MTGVMRGDTGEDIGPQVDRTGGRKILAANGVRGR